MSILVTGGAGFVGLNLVEALLGRGESVVIIDRTNIPSYAQHEFSKFPGALSIVTGDICGKDFVDSVFKRYDVRQVVHAAVITADADRESRDPSGIVEVNVQGTLNLLKAAYDNKSDRFLYVGSGAAYGRTHAEGIPLEEDVTPSRPQDIYGITKFAAEQIALRLGTLWNLDTLAVRLGSVFGPWELDTGVRDLLSPYLQAARLAVRGEIAVVPQREVLRDWVYSRDVAEGLIALLVAPQLFHRSYHLSSGLDWRNSFAQWCDTLASAYQRFSWTTAVPGEKANIDFLVEQDRAPMDMQRIARDVGFKARFGPRDAYSDYIEWIHRNEKFLVA